MRPVEVANQLPVLIGSGPHESYLHSLVQALTRVLINMALRINGALPKDGSEGLTAYTVATRPSAAGRDGAIIYVSDAGAGAKFQGSNGATWVNLG